MPPRIAFALAACIFAVDCLTKRIIDARVSAFDVYSVIPGFFEIVNAKNRGIAFSIFSDSSSPWRGPMLIALSVAALVWVGRMLWNAARLDRTTALGLALIFGGAMGNVFDRVVNGVVTDFLDFYIGRLHWPAFNLADSAIVIGGALLLLDLIKPKRQPART